MRRSGIGRMALGLALVRMGRGRGRGGVEERSRERPRRTRGAARSREHRGRAARDESRRESAWQAVSRSIPRATSRDGVGWTDAVDVSRRSRDWRCRTNGCVCPPRRDGAQGWSIGRSAGRPVGRSAGRPVGRCLASIDAGRTQRCISHRRIRGTGFVIPSRKAVSAAVPDHRSRRFTELPRAVRTARGARFGRSRTRPLIGRRVTRATTTPARSSTCSALRDRRSVAQSAGSQASAIEFHAEGSACHRLRSRSAGTFPLPSDA